MRDRLEDLGRRLKSHGVVFPTPKDRKGALEAGLRDYSEIRRGWETGRVLTLPSIDVAGQDLTLEEIAVVSSVADFAIRRATDGLGPSRPLAVDGIRIADRVAGCLGDLEVELDGLESIPRKLVRPVYALCVSQFELCRALISYLVTHVAPDVSAGRDEPDGWLNHAETGELRRRLLVRVDRAHRLLMRLPRLMTEASWQNDLANLYASRIMVHAQVASIEAGPVELADRVRQADWLCGAEVADARDLMSRQTALGNNDDGRFLIASAILDLVEHGDVSLADAFAEASATSGLAGRNLVSILRTLLGFANEPDETGRLVHTILDEIDRIRSADGQQLRTECLPQLLYAVSALSRSDAVAGAILARRLAVLPEGIQLGSDHLWVVPGNPPVAILERLHVAPEVVELPALNNPVLLARIVNDHAEEFEVDHDLGRLRSELTSAIEPLRTPLHDCAHPVTIHAFGHFKHVPFAALTGRNSLLAEEPVVRLFALAPRPLPSKRRGRLWIADDDFSQVRGLPNSVDDTVFAYNSAAEVFDPRGELAFAALDSTELNEMWFFGHGHVDQFRVSHAGLVLHQSGERNSIVPSLQIAQFDLRHIELAVVMACGVGQGNVFVEPSLSIGHAFRAAGVQNVIAPQWPIVAEDALAFVVRYDQNLSKGDGYQQAWSNVLAKDPNRFISIALL